MRWGGEADAHADDIALDILRTRVGALRFPPFTTIERDREFTFNYKYRVRAVNSNGVTGPYSASVVVPPPSEPDLTKPVTAQLWFISSSPGWTCSEPPCAADYEAFGDPDVLLRTVSIDHDFSDQQGQLQAGLASRWSGRFRAPKTGDCYLTLSSRMKQQRHFALAHVQPVFIHTLRELRACAYYLVAFRPTVSTMGPR